jgi:hypothetical protein
MKKKTVLMGIGVMRVCGLVLTGCPKETDPPPAGNPLDGTWTYAPGGQVAEVIIANGSNYSWKHIVGGNLVIDEEGTFSASGTTITFTQTKGLVNGVLTDLGTNAPNPQAYTYSVSGNNLIVAGLTYTKS